MTDKEIIDVTKCIHFDKSVIPNGCTCYWDGECNHHCYYKKYAYKHQECEELRQYHNKCCIEFENEKQELLEKYNQVSRDFYNGKYCNKENCSLLKAKEQENKKLKEDEKSLLNIIDDLQKEKNKWVEKYNDLGQDFDQLKRTLTEIKEIAEENIRIADSEGLNGVYRRGLAKQILQKIS